MIVYEAGAKTMYKSYVVRRDNGKDYLCDSYVVQKNDWLIKIFKQRGEISEKDFSQFLRIFQRINPDITDINNLKTGQHILIPLKLLSDDVMPGQSTGVVTLPFVSIADDSDSLEKYSTEHIVQKGDLVSRLISKNFGKYGSTTYSEGMKLFKFLNPKVKNVNRIYLGQKLRLPDSALRNQPWYASLFDGSGKLNMDLLSKGTMRSDTIDSKEAKRKKSATTPETPIGKVASVLDAKLFSKGKYYFPQQGARDFEFDLSSIPVLQLPGGPRILISKGKPIENQTLALIRSFWKEVEIVSVAKEASEEQIVEQLFSAIGKDPEKNRLSFTDNGMKVEVRAKWIIDKPFRQGEKRFRICVMIIRGQDESTPFAVSQYLNHHGIIIKDIRLGGNRSNDTADRIPAKKTNKAPVTLNAGNQKALIKGLSTALGYQFAQNVSITFPYAGIQVKAVSNIVSLKDGNMLLVDFGYFFGDAMDALKKSGLDVIQIKSKEDGHVVVGNFLRAVKKTYQTDPEFLAAKRSVFNNISLTIPGFLTEDASERVGGSQLLLTTVPLNDSVVQLLEDRKIKIIRMLN